MNDMVVVDSVALLPIEDTTRSKVENAEDRQTFASNQPNLTGTTMQQEICIVMWQCFIDVFNKTSLLQIKSI